MARRYNPREEEHEEGTSEIWLIPYADVLTLLLALFIVLFASSAIDTQKFHAMMNSFNTILSGGPSVMDMGTIVPIGENLGQIGLSGYHKGGASSNNRNISGGQELTELQKQVQEETVRLEQLKGELDAYIEENRLTSQLSTELNNLQLVLRISDNALFASGSADVRQDARSLALAIADMLTDFPEYEVVVSGHTDNVPINNARFRDNWDLSTARALNFMKILLTNDKLDPARFSSIGYGEYRPVADNSTAEGRAQNRRVEVSIIRNIVASEPDMISPQ
jgi:chemotaxis protein MotB